MKRCIEQHPILSTVILSADSEVPEYATLAALDLSNHIDIIASQTDVPEHEHMVRVLNGICDSTFSNVDKMPPWKVVVSPLSTAASPAEMRLLIVFAYYHSHGDGRSALAFHRTFLDGLSSGLIPDVTTSLTCDPPTSMLLPPIEKSGNLYVSWSYLLGPLLSVYLPASISRALGFRPPAAEQQGTVWCGKPHTYNGAEDFTTGLEMLRIDHQCITAVLQKCKANSTTFTGLLNHLIARALGEIPEANAFASQIVVDLRQHLPSIGPDDMACAVTAYFETVPRSTQRTLKDLSTDEMASVWEAARKTSQGLVKTASTLDDQPTGLLQYLSNFRPWVLGQIGKPREASFEISNLVVFDPTSGKDAARQDWQVEQAVFAQPANVAGAAISFSLVTVKGGPLVLTASWQRGVLDLEKYGCALDEQSFVAKVCRDVEVSLRHLAGD